MVNGMYVMVQMVHLLENIKLKKKQSQQEENLQWKHQQNFVSMVKMEKLDYPHPMVMIQAIQ